MKPGVPRVMLVDVPPQEAERIIEFLTGLGLDAMSVEGQGDLEPVEVGVLRIDPGGRTVRVDGNELSMTLKEYGVLLALVRRAGAFVSRRELMAEVWQRPDTGSRTLDIHIRRLRSKLGPWGSAIETRVRVGYRLVPERLAATPAS